MYGTVARIQAKPGAEQALMAQFQEYGAIHVPGFRATYVYRMDSDPNMLYLAIVFDSKEAYRANAESPEQDRRYREMLALLEREPEWHDGEILGAIVQGG